MLADIITLGIIAGLYVVVYVMFVKPSSDMKRVDAQ